VIDAGVGSKLAGPWKKFRLPPFFGVFEHFSRWQFRAASVLPRQVGHWVGVAEVARNAQPSTMRANHPNMD
jgi:hypothetical protein